MNIDRILENTIPVIIGLVLTAIGTLAFHYRKGISIYLKRLKIKIFPLKFNIAFALDFNEGFNSGDYYKQIKSNFNSLLDKTGLRHQIRVIDFSDIFLFKNREEAEKFRNVKGIDLIIWGGFSNDNLKLKGEKVNKINLSFTLGHKKMSSQIGALVLLDLQSKIALKSYWSIFENDSLRDTTIVSNNIFDISTYILALILKIFGNLEKSTLLFETLHNDLMRRNDSFNEQLYPHLINCYDVLSLEYGLSGKDLELAISYCDKILLIDPNNFNGLANSAVFLYRNGKKELAIEKVEKLKCLYPNNPITIVDIAFFRIIQKDYERALKGYKKLLKFVGINFNVQEVVEFIDNQYMIYKDPALIFASGSLSCHFGDIKIGKSDIQRFIKMAKQPLHNCLIEESKKLMRLKAKL